MAISKITFITGNANKLREVKQILGDLVVLESRSVDLIEVQGSIEEIIAEKVKLAAAEVDGPVLVEDTCLAFDAMGELPGPYIKWFLQGIGLDGLNKMLSGFDNKGAQAICTFAFQVSPDTKPLIFQGRTHGTIVQPRGSTKFGWDPIFEYEGKTYAEMEAEEKNAISHRSKALALLKDWLAQNSASTSATKAT